MNIGEKIKILRLTKNFTQEAIAKIIGVSVTSFGDIERGTTKDITIIRIEQIAKALDVSLRDLFDETHEEHNNHNNHNNHHNPSTNTDLINLQQQMIENYKAVIVQKDKEAEQCKQLLNKANKELKKQKK